MPTLSLCVIAKNEESHMSSFSSSIEGVFDQVVFVDTGSQDKTREIAESFGFEVHDFAWVKDFAKARNFSFSHATSDYVMWMDLDDVLTPESRASLVEWKDSVMGTCDFWLAPYHYAHNPKGDVVCEFLRDRVMRRSSPIEWKYFLHEGLTVRPGGQVSHGVVKSWHVTHTRTAQDLEKDRGRNLDILKFNEKEMSSRMLYYYGKELFDAGRHVEAIGKLAGALEDLHLEKHDRVLAMQYLGYAYLRANSHEQALGIATSGLMLASHRAELHCIAGDALVNLKKYKEAIPFYFGALACDPDLYARMNGAIFLTKELYGPHPLAQITKLYSLLGNHKKALELATDLVKRYPDNQDHHGMLNEAKKLAGESNPSLPQVTLLKTQDIVFTAPLKTPKLWDEEVLETGFLGGSETACIEMAREFKKKYPERRVLVFNDRPKSLEAVSGVEYLSINEIPLYFQKYEPALHIAWRHTHRFTKAPSYVWCHDLMVPGLENTQNYDKVLVLSKFHKAFVKSHLNLPDSKFHVTRNALNLELFKGVDLSKKDRYKVVFSSSPDRGLLETIKIMDKVVEVEPKASLHVYYGLDNLLAMAKMTNNAQLFSFAETIQSEIAKRPYIKFHGAVSKPELIKELATASVWLYPTTFLETFCITALEMAALGVIPIARDYGALRDTLSTYINIGFVKLLDAIPSNVPVYADAVLEALYRDRKDPTRGIVRIHESFDSWKSVCSEWSIDLLACETLEVDSGVL